MIVDASSEKSKSPLSPLESRGADKELKVLLQKRRSVSEVEGSVFGSNLKSAEVPLEIKKEMKGSENKEEHEPIDVELNTVDDQFSSPINKDNDEVKLIKEEKPLPFDLMSRERERLELESKLTLLSPIATLHDEESMEVNVEDRQLIDEIFNEFNKAEGEEISTEHRVLAVKLNYDAGPVECLKEPISDDSDEGGSKGEEGRDKEEKISPIRKPSPLPPSSAPLSSTSVPVSRVRTTKALSNGVLSDGSSSSTNKATSSKYIPSSLSLYGSSLLVSPEVVGRLVKVVEGSEGEEVESREGSPTSLTSAKAKTVVWEKYSNAEGRVYYYNEAKNISQWDRPSEASYVIERKESREIIGLSSLRLTKCGGLTPNSGDSLLHAAVSYGYVDDAYVLSLLSSKNSWKACNSDGESPLHYACFNMYYFGITSLVESGASFSARDNFGRTCIFSAALATQCTPDFLDFLAASTINYDDFIDYNHTDFEGNSVLHLLAAVGNLACASYIIEKQGVGDINKKNKDGESALHVACSFGQENIVEMLLSFGALDNEENGLGETPWKKAMSGNFERIASLLQAPTLPVVGNENQMKNLRREIQGLEEKVDLLTIDKNQAALKISNLSSVLQKEKSKVESFQRDSAKKFADLQLENENLAKLVRESLVREGSLERSVAAASLSQQEAWRTLQEEKDKHSMLLNEEREKGRSMTFDLQAVKLHRAELEEIVSREKENIAAWEEAFTALKQCTEEKEANAQSQQDLILSLQLENINLHERIESLNNNIKALNTKFIEKQDNKRDLGEGEMDTQKVEGEGEGWEAITADDGFVYYYNKITGEYWSDDGLQTQEVSGKEKKAYNGSSPYFRSKKTSNYFKNFQNLHREVDVYKESSERKMKEEGGKEEEHLHEDKETMVDDRYVYEQEDKGLQEEEDSLPLAYGAYEEKEQIESKPTSPQRVVQIWERFFDNALRVSMERRASEGELRDGNFEAREVFFQAIREGDVEIVDSYLDNGIDLSITDDIGNSALHYAASSGDVNILSSLIENGAEIDVLNIVGNSPLIESVMNGSLDCLRFLLQSMADVSFHNSEGDTALHCAVKLQDIDIVRLLLNYNADIHDLNSLGESALDLITSVIMSEKQDGEALLIFQLLNNNGEEQFKETIGEYVNETEEGHRKVDDNRNSEYNYSKSVHSTSPAIDSLSVALSDFSLQTDEGKKSPTSASNIEILSPTSSSSSIPQESKEEGGSYWSLGNLIKPLWNEKTNISSRPAIPSVAHLGTSKREAFTWDEENNRWKVDPSLYKMNEQHLKEAEVTRSKASSAFSSCFPPPPIPTIAVDNNVTKDKNTGRRRQFVDPFTNKVGL